MVSVIVTCVQLQALTHLQLREHAQLHISFMHSCSTTYIYSILPFKSRHAHIHQLTLRLASICTISAQPTCPQIHGCPQIQWLYKSFMMIIRAQGPLCTVLFKFNYHSLSTFSSRMSLAM